MIGLSCNNRSPARRIDCWWWHYWLREDWFSTFGYCWSHGWRFGKFTVLLT
jgi:hypothetical protein